jgi:hypothetical protein
MPGATMPEYFFVTHAINLEQSEQRVGQRYRCQKHPKVTREAPNAAARATAVISDPSSKVVILMAITLKSRNNRDNSLPMFLPTDWYKYR